MSLLVAAALWVMAPTPRDPSPSTATAAGVREAVVRHLLNGNPRPFCPKLWDGKTYCVSVEGGADPSDDFMRSVSSVAPGAKKQSECTQAQQQAHSEIEILEIRMLSPYRAAVRVGVFCGATTLDFDRHGKAWIYSDKQDAGGFIGSCITGPDCR